MGCDIHFYVEKLVDGAWILQPPPDRDRKRWPYARGDAGTWAAKYWGPNECMVEYGCDDCAKKVNGKFVSKGCEKCLGSGKELSWYHGRNYFLFAALADVRNRDEERIKPFAVPRGIPTDAHKRTREILEGIDIHTPSYYGLDELLAADWSRIEKAGDIFVEFMNTIVIPHFFGQNHEYQQLAEILKDAEHPGFGTAAGFDAVRIELTPFHKTIRFVFGFDN